MRELKFRVWDKVDERIKYADIEWFDDMFAFRFEHRGFEEDDNSDVVIMQFIGLKDKNGIDIYEGDIVRPFGDQGSLAQIIFFAPSFKLATKLNNGSYNLWNYYKDEIEIIVNIHQNPELIK